MSHSALLIVFLALSQIPVRAQIDDETPRPDRKVKPLRISGKITIDGRLDEPEWSGAPLAGGFIQREPREGEPASEQTEVRVIYDRDSLYFGVSALDSRVKSAIVSELKKDFNTQAGDTFEMILDTFHDQRNGYHFAVNPAGARWDAQVTNEGRVVDVNWDGVWYAATAITEEAWTAEISVPFKTLKFRSAQVQSWGMNFKRYVRRKNEESYWAPVPRIYTLSRVSLAGTLQELEEIKPKLNLRLKPSAVASSVQTRGAARDSDADFGLDAKYGLTPGLTWDFTYNTDFSQVEADQQQINLTRFTLFFPEKRDFFLENSGMFQFGESMTDRPPLVPGAATGTGGGGRKNMVGSSMVLFFPRSIGLSAEGTPIPIGGGTRLTGRAGPYEIGLLNIQQRRFRLSRAANFTVGRFRRNILSNSDVGAIVTNKEVLGSSHFNRVIGADANFRFFRRLNINSHLAKSSSPGQPRHDLAGRFNLSYRHPVWDFQSYYTAVQENFINEMGFVPRLGITRSSAYLARRFRPRGGRSLLRQIVPHGSIDYLADRNGSVQTRQIDQHLSFIFQDGSFIEAGVNGNLENLNVPFDIRRSVADIRRSVAIPTGLHKFDEYFVVAESNDGLRISGNARWAAGRFYTGNKQTYELGSTQRWNYRFNTSADYARNNIHLPQGYFRTHLLTLRVNYSFSTAMFLNTLVQYNSEAGRSGQWSSNIRFNIRYRPLSDFYLVYNERRDTAGTFLDRALIAKFTYMISP